MVYAMVLIRAQIVLLIVALVIRALAYCTLAVMYFFFFDLIVFEGAMELVWNHQFTALLLVLNQLILHAHHAHHKSVLMILLSVPQTIVYIYFIF